ncbi:MAG: glycosyltransferase family 4 protein [Chloroflexi bacterium]|jgi:glycogen(starch) synthase|nr:glycosyltransferase family 4 protein [Chloroflexota bacterium]GIW09120.1 MAG: glycosyl transferase [Dehalococcoidia bacterium]
MRILMLSWEYPPHLLGGLGKHVMELVPELDAAGVEVHLVTPRWAGGAPEERVGAHSVVYRVDPPQAPSGDFFHDVRQANFVFSARGRDLIEQLGGFALIHCHDWLVSFAGIDLKHAFKLPLLATIHATEWGRNHGSLQTDLQRAIHNAEWWLTFEAWRLITTTEFMRREVETAFGVPADKIDVIPNGIDPSRFDRLRREHLASFRARWAAPEESLVFNVGRVVWEKGVQVLVEAVPRVLVSRPATKFVVAGTGGALETVRARAAQLGVEGHLTFTGFISDDERDRLFCVADCAVFPSLYEPFGIVALEAFAARVPVVASDVGGFSEIITNHETGILVSPNNPDSLAWGILHTLNHPEWSRARVENAYRVATTRYSWRAIAAQTIRCYEQVVAERAETVW